MNATKDGLGTVETYLSETHHVKTEIASTETFANDTQVGKALLVTMPSEQTDRTVNESDLKNENDTMDTSWTTDQSPHIQ